MFNNLSMVVLPKREMCFWAAEIRKKLDFFKMHKPLGPGAQKLLRYKWRKMDAASFLFRIVGENNCIVSWNETFSSVGHVSGWSFLVLQSCRNVWKWIPKLIWPLMDWFWSFSSEYCFFCWLHICNYGSDINERNWLQLLFYLILLKGTVASVIGMSFFQLCFRF